MCKYSLYDIIVNILVCILLLLYTCVSMCAYFCVSIHFCGRVLVSACVCACMH